MNRLANETSPYLLQHKDNPVDWYPWSEEAFEKARREDKPLLVSIGYSACHWCHVMEHESFENEDMARLINSTVVPVKVDREERPDVDAIYMDACMAMNGSGGWPLNAFVTPDLKPFFVGTYFPPDDRFGRPGFAQIVRRIGDLWRSPERLEVIRQASVVHEHISHIPVANPQTVDSDVLDRVVRESASSFDMKYGGFGSAPKFPPDQRLALLLAAWRETKSEAALNMVTGTLDGMARGGMYDQLGGGFARYSVDAEWLIPHFEKMLYNQALLVPVYLDAWLATERALYRRVAVETLDWVLRDMTAPEGVFYSALDADSEGEEGKYYVWTPEQINAVLGGDDAALFAEYYGMQPGGNFEHGTSALRVLMGADEFAREHGMSAEDWLKRLDALKQKMLASRSARVAPGTDDKAITGWNGLMISALARGRQVLGDERYIAAARRAADFILERQCDEGGELLRVYCKGRSHVAGVLDDYAYFIAGLIDLYETCFEMRYLRAAERLADAMVSRFHDGSAGVFMLARADDKSLISRTAELHDGALPAGAAVAALDLLRLAALNGNEELARTARGVIEAGGQQANRVPNAFASLIMAHLFGRPATPQIVVAGERDSGGVRELLEVVWRTYVPFRSIALGGRDGTDMPKLAKGKVSERPAAFVCREFTCEAPVYCAGELQAALGAR